jgi:undecaprenyl diphosphate synthase
MMTGQSPVPAHVAIVMDGNGRWARHRGLPRIAGHRKGVDRIHPVALACAARGIDYLTLYAFSTENWRRPRTEVSALLRLLESMIEDESRTCLRDNIRLRLIGTLERLSDSLRSKVDAAIEMNRSNTGITLCLAFDYGSRDEMVRAARVLAASGPPEDIDEEAVSRNLYTAGMPDVDLLIRCGGELRLSNFLMWQAAYAELYFTDVLWPSFGEEALDATLAAFAARHRRFGGLTAGGGA